MNSRWPVTAANGFPGQFRAASATAKELSQQLAFSRRDFLRASAGLALGSALLQGSPLAYAATPLAKRKVVVITFGGGARDQETFAPEGRIFLTWCAS